MQLKAKVFWVTLLAVSMLFLAVSFAQESFPFMGEVNSENINIRSDSTVSSQIICRVNKGEQVEVVAELYEWYKVRLPKSAPSFIKNTLAVIINNAPNNTAATDTQLNPATNPPPVFNKEAKVLKDRVNIRLSPSESSAVLGIVNQGQVVTVLEERKGWLKIEPMGNSFGWINKKFISKVVVTQE